MHIVSGHSLHYELCTTAQMHNLYTSAHLHNCITVQLNNHTTAQLHNCTAAQLHISCGFIQNVNNTIAQWDREHQFARVKVFKSSKGPTLLCQLLTCLRHGVNICEDGDWSFLLWGEDLLLAFTFSPPQVLVPSWPTLDKTLAAQGIWKRKPLFC